MAESKIVLFDSKENCCGCEACVNICPKNAITMKSFELGIEFPVIDNNLCIGCGMCEKVCQYKNTLKLNNVKSTYAAVNSNDSSLKKSASGGVFYSLAESFISSGGVVYGCSMEKNEGKLTAMHIRVDSIEMLSKLQGSKYVQSKMGRTYENIKQDLKDGRKVLFSGTPCQVSGLKQYLLNKEYENLYTIDLICHGVPSNNLFHEYLDYLENKYDGKIQEYIFRDKTKSDIYVSKYALLKKNSKKIKVKYVSHKLSSYYNMFLNALTFRESCYSCLYAKQDRVSDITIGDFWGIENEHPELLKSGKLGFDISKGISCMLVNTEKGSEILKIFGNGLSIHKSTLNKVSNKNKQLNQPMKLNEDERNRIMSEFEKGYDLIDRNYYKSIGVKKYVYIANSLISNKLKNRVKNIIKMFKVN